MNTQVVVLGSGYTGAGAVTTPEEELGPGAQLAWVAEHDYHLVLHEVHHCIRDSSVESSITIPVDDVKDDSTELVKGRATGVDVDERAVELEGGDTINYDYLLVTIGSSTAFFGIEGPEEFIHQLKGLDDTRETHQEIKEAAADASYNDPAQVVIGGAGLFGIQTAAEVAEYRDTNRAPIGIKLIEGMDEIFPGNDPELQDTLRRRVEDLDVDILTGDLISKVDEETVFIGGGEDEALEGLDYDTLTRAGGITGQPEASDTELEQDKRFHRFSAEEDFQTSDDRVFAVGDCALVEQGPDNVVPLATQAVWDTVDVAGENIAWAIAGKPLKRWTFTDKGMVISIGHDAIAHDVKFPVFGELPVNVLGGPPAQALKKGIAANWIADVTSLKRVFSAWNDL